MRIIDKLIKIILLISILALITSFVKKDMLPNREDILEELYTEPVQTKIEVREFAETRNDIAYIIEPLFEYKLYGMVVTYHNSNSWLDTMHSSSKDFINTKDITVIWGYNLKEGDYQQVKFSHSDAAGYYYAPSRSVKFNARYFSNNHLLASTTQINNTIMEVQTGDQIYLEGYLVNYAHVQGGSRNTSITREDTEGYSCEIIYLTDFKILKKGNPEWRLLYRLSKFSVIGCLVLLLVLFLFVPFNRKRDNLQ